MVCWREYYNTYMYVDLFLNNYPRNAKINGGSCCRQGTKENLKPGQHQRTEASVCGPSVEILFHGDFNDSGGFYNGHPQNDGVIIFMTKS